jgi:predicted PurR-regulated permease PerM
VAKKSSTSGSLLAIASFVIVVAGAKVASEILVPVILATFLATLVSPLLQWVVARRVPRPLAIITVLTLVLGTAGGIGYLLGDSVADFSRRIPEFEQELRAKMAAFSVILETVGFEVRGVDLIEAFDTKVLMDLVGGTLAALGAIVSEVFFVMVTLGFLLAEVAGLPRKLRLAFGVTDGSSLGGQSIIRDIHRYLWVKTIVSVLTGVGAWLILLAFRVEYAFLWALVAFLLNYIPQIGSMVASIPPVLLGWIQYDGASALGILVCLIMLNGALGTVVEPRWMGRTFGISALVVFLSLLFWGWLWGPVGMLLAVPLTMLVKILLSHDENTRWIAVLLGSGRELRQLQQGTGGVREVEAP